MKLLEDKIISDGIIVTDDILKVDSFLNQQIDTSLLFETANEIKRLFQNEEITKVVTIEASGIAIASVVGELMKKPVVYAKKHVASTKIGKQYTAQIHSFTHDNDYIASIPEAFLNEFDKVLIVDDFLAYGEAINGLIKILDQASAKLVGCAVLVEKYYQGGGKKLREKGIRVESLACVDSMSKEEGIKFIESPKTF